MNLSLKSKVQSPKSQEDRTAECRVVGADKIAVLAQWWPGLRKRHRTAALQNLTDEVAFEKARQRFGVRQSYAALGSSRWQGHQSLSRRDRSVLTSAATSVEENAFSLIEIMVTIALLSFIVLGLLAMFNQTQRAFRSSMTQVDVLEAGRAVTDMMARDIEQTVPGELPSFTTNGVRIISTNFFAEYSTYFKQPVLQGLPGTQENRTNVFQDIFLLTKQNLDYIGIGYQVRPDFQNGIVGTLYRFSTNRTKGFASLLSTEFRQAEAINWSGANTTPTNMSRIADGVVHFRVRVYDTNGFPFDLNTLYTNAMFRTNAFVQQFPVSQRYAAMRNSTVSSPMPAYPDQLNYYFFSNAVPAYVELEIGFLEPHILDRLKAIGDDASTVQFQRQYLSNHVANVHLFRRRIPIRNVDFLAYQ